MTLTLINTAAAPSTVTIRLLNGTTLDEVALHLDPHEKRIINPVALFDHLTTDQLDGSAMELRAGYDMAGYYAFWSPGDVVRYPLLQEEAAQTRLSVPHVASDGYWWTALNLFNASDETVVYRMMPYDAGGAALNHLERTGLELPAKTKQVVTLAGVYGDEAVSISSLDIIVTRGPGLMGTLGYGNPDCAMLSGRILQ
jgi:hypothetical protein